MKYGYTQVAGVWMPLLRVVVHMPNGFSSRTMLVDSGSEYTLVRLSWLARFGVELGDEHLDLAGVGDGEGFFGRPATVEFAVEGRRFAADIVAVEDRYLPFGILGHRGFFEHFRVTFETASKSFAIRPMT
jgi:hypothetical protein